MKNYLSVVLLVSVTVFAQTAVAAEATFCRSERTTANPGRDDMQFTCGNGLKGTVPQFYQAGWRVVAYDRRQSADTTDNVMWAVILLEKN